jgi:hypothetical protein
MGQGSERGGMDLSPSSVSSPFHITESVLLVLTSASGKGSPISQMKESGTENQQAKALKNIFIRFQAG